MALSRIYPASVHLDVIDLQCAADGFKFVHQRNKSRVNREDREIATQARACAAILYALAKGPKTEDELLDEYEAQLALIDSYDN